MIANFNEIRQNSRISRGNMGKFRCIYCSIVGKIARAMKRTDIEKIRLGRTKIGSKRKINDGKDERNKGSNNRS